MKKRPDDYKVLIGGFGDLAIGGGFLGDGKDRAAILTVGRCKKRRAGSKVPKAENCPLELVWAFLNEKSLDVLVEALTALKKGLKKPAKGKRK